MGRRMLCKPFLLSTGRRKKPCAIISYESERVRVAIALRKRSQAPPPPNPNHTQTKHNGVAKARGIEGCPPPPGSQRYVEQLYRSNRHPSVCQPHSDEIAHSVQVGTLAHTAQPTFEVEVIDTGAVQEPGKHQRNAVPISKPANACRSALNPSFLKPRKKLRGRSHHWIAEMLGMASGEFFDAARIVAYFSEE